LFKKPVTATPLLRLSISYVVVCSSSALDVLLYRAGWWVFTFSRFLHRNLLCSTEPSLSSIFFYLSMTNMIPYPSPAWFSPRAAPAPMICLLVVHLKICETAILLIFPEASRVFWMDFSAFISLPFQASFWLKSYALARHSQPSIPDGLPLEAETRSDFFFFDATWAFRPRFSRTNSDSSRPVPVCFEALYRLPPSV